MVPEGAHILAAAHTGFLFAVALSGQGWSTLFPHASGPRVGQRLGNGQQEGQALQDPQPLPPSERAADYKLANDGLREGADLYHRLVEAVDDVVLVKDLEGRFIVVNSEMARRCGCRKEDIVGKTSIEVHGPTVGQLMVNADQQVLSSGETWDRVVEFPGRQRARVCHIRKVPLWSDRGEVVGLVTVSRDITEQKRAEQALRESLDRTKKLLDGVIGAMSALTEMRDPFTAGHQRKVARLTEAIGREMGLSEQETEGIRVAGLVHDIGKITAPIEILSKPGRISRAERSIMMEHPVAGYEILRSIEFPWPVAEMALQHHERMDGSGYPSGLSGDNIIPGARILAVADVVEGMSSHRPYRAALGIDSALQEISDQRGRLYDPRVVEACLVLFRKQAFSFE